jgi:hypothetical protein
MKFDEDEKFYIEEKKTKKSETYHGLKLYQKTTDSEDWSHQTIINQISRIQRIPDIDITDGK